MLWLAAIYFTPFPAVIIYYIISSEGQKREPDGYSSHPKPSGLIFSFQTLLGCNRISYILPAFAKK